MSQLRIYQSLWASERAIAHTPEPSFEERFDEIKTAGFDGVALDLGALPLERAMAIIPQFARAGLGGLATAFPDSIEAIRPAIHFAKDIGAPLSSDR